MLAIRQPRVSFASTVVAQRMMDDLQAPDLAGPPKYRVRVGASTELLMMRTPRSVSLLPP